MPSSQERRAYRIDRIRSAELLDQSATSVPDGLDPVATLEEHLASGWEYETEVLIDAPLDDVAWLPRTLGRLEPFGSDRTRLTGSTSNPYWYAEQLITVMPAPYRIVRGPELRRTTMAWAAQTSAPSGDPRATDGSRPLPAR